MKQREAHQKHRGQCWEGLRRFAAGEHGLPGTAQRGARTRQRDARRARTAGAECWQNVGAEPPRRAARACGPSLCAGRRVARRRPECLRADAGWRAAGARILVGAHSPRSLGWAAGNPGSLCLAMWLSEYKACDWHVHPRFASR